MIAERKEAFSDYFLIELEVVGNFHDNPELIGGESHG